MSSIKPPGSLQPSNLTINDFQLWLEAFNDYVEIAHEKADDVKKKKLFLAVGGLELRRLVNGLNLDDNSFETMVRAVKHHFQPVKNVVLERHKFFSLTRSGTEDIQSFMLRLKTAANDCDFGSDVIDSFTNQMIRDQLIRGLNNTKITEFLLTHDEMNLQRTIEKAEGMQQAINDSQAICQRIEPVLALNQDRNDIRSEDRPYSNDSEQKGLKFHKQSVERRCNTCKKRGHESKQCYKNARCGFCSKIGHTEDVCWSKRKDQNTHVSASLSLRNDDDKYAYPDSPSASNLKFVDAMFGGRRLKLLIDTGAAFSTIGKRFLSSLDNKVDRSSCSMNAVVADGRTVKVHECVTGELEINSKSIFATLYALDTPTDGILGMDLIPTVGLKLGNDCGLVFNITPNDIVCEYKDIFDKPLAKSSLTGIEPFEIIRLQENSEPKQCALIKMNAKHKDFVEAKVKELLHAGVIVESRSPWRHTPVVVNKSDGSLRMTINYKPVNSTTIADAFPIPNVTDLLNRLSGAKYFSSIDFSQFYHQLPLSPSDQEKTAFCANDRLYQFTRCPFGLKNAVAYCSRLMSKVFEGIENVLIYLDDVLVFGRTKEDHDDTLRRVLQTVREHNLSLNIKKCSFSTTVADFLGHLIENGEVRPDPTRLQPLMEFPLPNNAKALQRYLGMTTYYSKYIEYYSEKSKSLFNKVACFDDWTPAEMQSFELLKEEIKKAVLYLPSLNENLVLRTDASNDTISAILENDEKRPIYFCSRKLSQAERSADIVEKEALAIFWGINRLRMFLLCRKFTILCDHKPLQFIFNNEKCSPKVLRWKLQLQEFNFHVKHCSGASNVVADCLSRINNLDFEPLPIVNESDVIRAQVFDTEVKALIEVLTRKSKIKPEAVKDLTWKARASLKIENGILLHENDRIFVPFSKRLKLLTVAHGCHHGEKATIERLKSRFFWPGMHDACKTFVKECRTCSLTKPKFKDAHMNPVLVKAPLECLACDFFGPLPSSKGNCYGLVVIDVFSRFPFVFPLKNICTANLISKLSEVFALTGFPDAILSDQGTQFESEDFKTFLNKFNIKKLRTNAFHPAGNGICERFNGIFKKSMLSYLTERKRSMTDWTDSVNHCLLDYRTTSHGATGCRPVDLFFSFKSVGYMPSGQSPVDEAVAKDLQSKAKSRYSKTTAKQSYIKGGRVLVHESNRPKFGLRGVEATVIKQFDEHSVLVKNLETGRVFRCSTSRLSPVCTRSVTSQPDSFSSADRQNADESDYSESEAEDNRISVEAETDSDDEVGDDEDDPVPDRWSNRPKRRRQPPNFYGDRRFFHVA